MAGEEDDDLDVEIEVEGEGEVESEAPAKPEAKAAPEPDFDKDPDEDELATYSKGVQTRIRKLTAKFRAKERETEEATRLARQILEENNQLKGRVQQLDTGYLTEYGARLAAQEEDVKRRYKTAHEAGDTENLLAAQQELATIAIDKERHRMASGRAAAQQAQTAQAPAAPAPQPRPQQQQRVTPDTRAQKWAEDNTWFGTDRVLTAGALAVHAALVEDEGFDPTSDAYYTELDKRVRKEFPNRIPGAAKTNGRGPMVGSASSSASRTPSSARRTVKLSASQVSMAKRLGVPLEEYAKYVKD